MENDNFARLLKNTSEEYIGVGNPDAKILIIANEPGIDKDNKEQSNKEVACNHEMWQTINDGNFKNKTENNPRFPYRGQLYTFFRACQDAIIAILQGRLQKRILQVLFTQHSQLKIPCYEEQREYRITIPSGGTIMSMKKNLFVMMSQYGELLNRIGG